MIAIPVHDGRFVMVRQWRHGLEGITTEFPGGVQEDGETVFYTFDADRPNPDGTPNLLEPLLRLSVVTDPIMADGMQANGYLLLRQQNGRYYLGKTESGNRLLSISDSELLFAMRFL